MVPLVEIVSVGNELLIGKTLNTNVQWIAKRIASLGLQVYRITTIGDDVNEISSVLQEAVRRRPSLIITTGGLGPTFDDKTLEGIAKGLGFGLKIEDQAMKMVEEKYRRYVEEGRMERVELTPHRLKMAKLPKEAKPLFNPVGTAPGVIMKKNGVTIVALPGVPPEMKAIFEGSVVPLLKEAVGNVTVFETSINVNGVMESEIAPIIDRVMHDNPYVYIKSHPKFGEGIPRLEFHLSTTAQDSKAAKNRVGKALVQLKEMIQVKGGKIKPSKRSTVGIKRFSSTHKT